MKLYRFRYSPYARKVQMVLELAGIRHEVVEVPYADRDELATVTGGYCHVPVLVTDEGKVLFDSRVIAGHLVARGPASHLVPSPLEGPIWAYANWIESELEDTLFRIASPGVRDKWARPGERALYMLVKERKYGAGCIDAWERDRDAIIAKARAELAPTLRTLASRPFLFGEKPTLADATLYGQCAMLEEADAKLLPRVAEELALFARGVESARPA